MPRRSRRSKPHHGSKRMVRAASDERRIGIRPPRLRTGTRQGMQRMIGTLATGIGIGVMMLPDFGVQLALLDGLGPATPMVSSLLATVGAIFIVGSLRRYRFDQTIDKRTTLAYALGLGGLGIGIAILLIPTFSPSLQDSAAVNPLVGVLCIAFGIVASLYALHRHPSDAIPEDAPTSALEKLQSLWPRNFFLKTWQALDTEAKQEREQRHSQGLNYDYRALIIFAFGAVFLAQMEYFGHGTTFRHLIAHFAPAGVESGFWAAVRDSSYGSLLGFVWWSGWRVFGFLLLPMLVIKVALGEDIASHGLNPKGFRQHAWIYGLGFCLVLLLVIGVSHGEAFQTYYPFYRNASRSWYDFWTWEMLYAAQFFSLEFFFRGFWLRGAKSSMGSHAIYAMIVPYCMIHFGKPFPETIGAILAGIFLGTLAMRTRSIWSGFLIHVSVAISMDMAALIQTRGLPAQWFP